MGARAMGRAAYAVCIAMSLVTTLRVRSGDFGALVLVWGPLMIIAAALLALRLGWVTNPPEPHPPPPSLIRDVLLILVLPIWVHAGLIAVALGRGEFARVWPAGIALLFLGLALTAVPRRASPGASAQRRWMPVGGALLTLAAVMLTPRNPASLLVLLSLASVLASFRSPTSQ